jgi:hypothetical protein
MVPLVFPLVLFVAPSSWRRPRPAVHAPVRLSSPRQRVRGRIPRFVSLVLRTGSANWFTSQFASSDANPSRSFAREQRRVHGDSIIPRVLGTRRRGAGPCGENTNQQVSHFRALRACPSEQGGRPLRCTCARRDQMIRGGCTYGGASRQRRRRRITARRSLKSCSPRWSPPFSSFQCPAAAAAPV